MDIDELFLNNRRWQAQRLAEQPDFFQRLSGIQTPEYLWIGCADSRVPANEIVGLLPGEMFVHRNIANVVVHSDMNLLSVLQYAVELLQVRHVIVCGHYGCGGVAAALQSRKHGLIDNWIRHIKDIYVARESELDSMSDPARLDALCEMNVRQQAVNVACTTIVQDAWDRGQEIAVHGVIYGLRDGLLKDLGVHIRSKAQLREPYRTEADAHDGEPPRGLHPSMPRH